VALILDAKLRHAGVQAVRFPVEQIAAATVDAPALAEIVGQEEVRRLVAEIDPVLRIDVVAEQELVAEMSALMGEAEEGGKAVFAVDGSNADNVVGVDQVFALAVEIENRKDTRLKGVPPIASEAPAAEQRERLPETHCPEKPAVQVSVEMLISGR